MQYPEQLGRQRANGKDDTRDIAARPLDACDQTNSDRVGSNDEYDRRRRGCGFACLRRFADELTRQLGVAKELLPELAKASVAIHLWDGYRLPHQRRFPMWQRAQGAALIIPRPCRGTRADAYGPHGRQPQGFRAL